MNGNMKNEAEGCPMTAREESLSHHRDHWKFVHAEFIKLEICWKEMHGFVTVI